MKIMKSYVLLGSEGFWADFDDFSHFGVDFDDFLIFLQDKRMVQTK